MLILHRVSVSLLRLSVKPKGSDKCGYAQQDSNSRFERIAMTARNHYAEDSRSLCDYRKGQLLQTWEWSLPSARLQALPSAFGTLRGYMHGQITTRDVDYL